MGYGTYERDDGRMGGYNVEAVCDAAGCDAQIDRGMSYLCGRGPSEEEWTCGDCFCTDHLHHSRTNDAGQLCSECWKQQERVLNENAEHLFSGARWLLGSLGWNEPEDMPDPPRHSYSGRWPVDLHDLILDVRDYSVGDEYRAKRLQDEAGEMYDMVGDLMGFIDPDVRLKHQGYGDLRDLLMEMRETAGERRWKEARETATS